MADQGSPLGRLRQPRATTGSRTVGTQLGIPQAEFVESGVLFFDGEREKETEKIGGKQKQKESHERKKEYGFLGCF